MAFPKTPARKLVPGGAAMAQTVAGAGLGFDLDGAGRFFSDLWELIKAKADELFPQETRSETLQRWLHVAVTVVIPAALAALALLCLARCCCRCCCASGGRRRAMMVAPGRGGARMPRGAFEGDPSRYFRDLRAGKPLVY